MVEVPGQVVARVLRHGMMTKGAARAEVAEVHRVDLRADTKVRREDIKAHRAGIRGRKAVTKVHRVVMAVAVMRKAAISEQEEAIIAGPVQEEVLQATRMKTAVKDTHQE